jgi:hypothetical protein
MLRVGYSLCCSGEHASRRVIGPGIPTARWDQNTPALFQSKEVVHSAQKTVCSAMHFTGTLQPTTSGIGAEDSERRRAAAAIVHVKNYKEMNK